MKNESEKKFEEAIEKSGKFVAKGDYESAIQLLESICILMKKHPTVAADYIDFVLWTLGNLYGITSQYEKAVEIEELEINNIMKTYNIKYLNEANLDDEMASRLISLYLCCGTAYMNLNRTEEAKNQYERGYMLSYLQYGEYDVRSLKQAYNIACHELLSGEEQEGIRQIKSCYFDMREHLGIDNEYTKKAMDTLLKLKEDPDQLYKIHMEMREIIKTQLCKMWEV
jgi:tetratricopeptide (TPR) repeat protein